VDATLLHTHPIGGSRLRGSRVSPIVFWGGILVSLVVVAGLAKVERHGASASMIWLTASPALLVLVVFIVSEEGAGKIVYALILAFVISGLRRATRPGSGAESGLDAD